eukprot:539175_1
MQPMMNSIPTAGPYINNTMNDKNTKIKTMTNTMIYAHSNTHTKIPKDPHKQYKQHGPLQKVTSQQQRAASLQLLQQQQKQALIWTVHLPTTHGHTDTKNMTSRYSIVSTATNAAKNEY